MTSTTTSTTATMNAKKKAATTTTNKKKEKIFHPNSRKAGQLERKQLRKVRLSAQQSKRREKESSETDCFSFFYHAMPPDVESISLQDLHLLIVDVWLKRHDEALLAEQNARRPGRPKSTRQVSLESAVERENEVYRTGMEVPDLTCIENVKLLRRWDNTDRAFFDLLRFVRISSENPALAVVSRPGKHESLKRVADEESRAMDVEEDENPQEWGRVVSSPSMMI